MEPCLYHCPKCDPGWEDFCRFAETVQIKPHFSPNITFITYNNTAELSLGEKVMRRHHLPYVVLAQNWKDWSWWAKIRPVIEYLKKCSTPLVGLVDSFDGFALPAPNIEKRFLEFGCDILFGPTPWDYPKHPECDAFEQKIYSAHKKPHLCAGSYFGKTQSILHVLQEILKERDGQHVHDQHEWRIKHKQLYPQIQIDVQEKLIVRHDITHQSKNSNKLFM